MVRPRQAPAAANQRPAPPVLLLSAPRSIGRALGHEYLPPPHGDNFKAIRTEESAAERVPRYRRRGGVMGRSGCGSRVEGAPGLQGRGGEAPAGGPRRRGRRAARDLSPTVEGGAGSERPSLLPPRRWRQPPGMPAGSWLHSLSFSPQHKGWTPASRTSPRPGTQAGIRLSLAGCWPTLLRSEHHAFALISPTQL